MWFGPRLLNKSSHVTAQRSGKSAELTPEEICDILYEESLAPYLSTKQAASPGCSDCHAGSILTARAARRSGSNLKLLK